MKALLKKHRSPLHCTILYGRDHTDFYVFEYVCKYAADFLVFPSTTSSTTSSCDTDFTKEDEQRLKDYIQQLKNDRAAVKLTMLELESVHTDTLSYDIKSRADSHRLDLENAVLMQELMAMKVYLAYTGTGIGVIAKTAYGVKKAF